MSLRAQVLYFMLCCIAFTKQQKNVDLADEIISHAVNAHLSECHVVMLSPIQQSTAFSFETSQTTKGFVVMTNLVDNSTFFKALLGDFACTCRGLVLQVGNTLRIVTEILRLLERTGFWKLPDTRVVVVGEEKLVDYVLLHSCFRNTIHAVYLALRNYAEVGVYRLCLHCNSGKRGIHLVGRYDDYSTIQGEYLYIMYDEQYHSLHGQHLKIVSVRFFPFIDFIRLTDVPGTRITPISSIDANLISTCVVKLNFSYSIWEETTQSWGRLENSSTMFTGMMGQLQREEVDFGTISGPTPERIAVMDHVRAYPSDLMTVISLKPSFLPQHLAIIRPLSGEVWIAVTALVVVMGTALWTFEIVLMRVGQGENLQLSVALLNSWAGLIRQPTARLPTNISKQVLMGWWLTFCLVVSVGYKSSLIANLSVVSKSKPPETLDDLAAAENWQWATEAWVLRGYPYEYFTKHKHPAVMKINRQMQVMPADKALKKVLKGQFSLINYEKYTTMVVASYFTDDRGRTPFQISNKGFSIMAAFGWGFRKGAPYYARFLQLINRLEDTGIITYWREEVIARRIKDNRKKAEPFVLESLHSLGSAVQALNLAHLQGAFYLLFFGCALAFLLMAWETFMQNS